jgi:type IV secretion system protein TrbL
MVLAVIVGIGSNLFDTLMATMPAEPDLAQAMTLVLGALSLVGIGIFGPSIASGLVAGAPQLGAGAAVGTVAGSAIALGAGARLGARALGAAGGAGISAIRAGASVGAAGGLPPRGGGGVAPPSGGSPSPPTTPNPRGSGGPTPPAPGPATAGGASAAPSTGGAGATPAWARKLQNEQRARAHRQAALHLIREGDRQGGSAHPDLSQKD